MNVSLYQAAAALNVNTRWQQTISENLASSQIPGFKKQELSFSTIAAGLIPISAAVTPNSPQRYYLPRATAATNFTPGQTKYTGLNTDMAIDGAAFFEVRLPNGQIAYTRDGEFRLNARGELVTKQGYDVVTTRGTVRLDPEKPQPLAIAADGEVSQGEDKLGKIKLTEFDYPQALSSIGNGFYMANEAMAQPKDSKDSTLRQGFVEMANTSSITEMAQLVNSMRFYEANYRLIQMQDERMGRVISELGHAN